MFVSSYFEEPETRDFIAEPELLSINDSQLSVIKVSGKLNDGEYPMDTFAVDAASGIKYFYSQEKNSMWISFGTPFLPARIPQMESTELKVQG